MTESKQELIAAMSLLAARRAGEYCSAGGYAQPTAEEIAEMTRLWIRHFEAFAAGFNPERELTDEEKDAIDAVVTGAAQGAVLRVIGLPPDVVLH